MFTLAKENRIYTIIPNQETLSDVIHINKNGTIQEIKVSISIQHFNIGDIVVQLTSPSGKTIALKNKGWTSIDDINKAFEQESLSVFQGESAKGNWMLTVQDNAAEHEGILETWSLDITCEEFEAYKSEIFITKEGELEQLTSTQECRFHGRVTKIETEIELEHPHIEDLTISLIAPSGKTITLRDKKGNNQNVLYKTWSSASLKDFKGEPVHGIWLLRVVSAHEFPSGSLKQWKIRFNFEQEEDLKIIEGIGPKVEEALKASGIYSYVSLASTPVHKIKRIFETADLSTPTIEPRTLFKQALLAAQGRWVDLEALKEEL